MIEPNKASSVPANRRSVSPRTLRRVIATLAVVTVVALLAAGLAPFALREQMASGAVADTASARTGQVETASDGLRGLGYSCSDRATSPRAVVRSCSRVQMMSKSRVQIVAADDTGAVRLVRLSIDEGRSSAAAHQEALRVVTEAVDLSPSERSTIVTAAAGGQRRSLTFDWGTAVVRPDVSDSTLRAAGSPGGGLARSPATLRVSVDALAATARAKGYTCMTPQVQTIRSCHRSDGGYVYSLWLQGTARHVTSLHIEVSSTYRTQTRTHWIEAMMQALSWVDSDQARRLSAWLARSADAPGADAYVDGLSISFVVRADEWGKETFGGIAAECARSMDDISGCDP